MPLLQLVFRQYSWAFIGILVLSILSAVLGIGVIAFINTALIQNHSADPWVVLPQFIGLIALLMAITLGSQLSLTTLGHYFVAQLRAQLVKQVLDTDLPQLEQIGGAKIQASLNADVRNITIAFVRLPELVQGIVLAIGSALYLGWLSLDLMCMTAVWLVVTIVGGWYLVSHVYRHLERVRKAEDELHADYDTLIQGRKELLLNRDRAEHFYQHRFQQNARTYRHHIIRADTFHLSAVNWSNIMMLSTIGLVFLCANSLHWADTNTAATFSLTLLFLRTPLLQAVGALPTLISAQVALKNIQQLRLAEFVPEFETRKQQPQWQTLTLDKVCFEYTASDAQAGFSVGPVSLTLRRGELLFLIGGNGSGKTTLAMLMTGLYRPTSGTILLDNTPIELSNITSFRALFSAVFTDFHLSGELLGSQGHPVNQHLVDEWLSRLGLQEKIQIHAQRVTSLNLSQGQKKRVALLLAVAEERDILLLDEWAADQDPQFRRFFYHDLLPQLQQMKKTIIAISHDDHYFEQADRLLEMRKGQLTELTGAARAQASRDAVAHLA